MESTDTVEERIITALERLSPMQKRMAHFVLDNLHFMSFASASQVGEKIDGSSASVVRFAQALGYEGYSDFQEALRTELPSYMTAARRMAARLSANTPPASTPQQVFYTDIHNIEHTAEKLSEEGLQSALDALQNARRIFVIGVGISSIPASFLTYSLKVMGFDAYQPQGVQLQPVIDLANLKNQDLLVAIDQWRYVRMTVNAVMRAKENGIPVLAITDSVVSPLAQNARIVLETVTTGVAHSQSPVAVISLLNVIIAMLADRVPEQVFESLRRIDTAYRDDNLILK